MTSRGTCWIRPWTSIPPTPMPLWHGRTSPLQKTALPMRMRISPGPWNDPEHSAAWLAWALCLSHQSVG